MDPKLKNTASHLTDIGILVIAILLFGMGMLMWGVAIYMLFHVNRMDSDSLWLNIVTSISLLVIAVAIFDVAKYLIEQEVFGTVQSKSELKQKLARFMSMIFVALMLESLLIVFISSKQDITLLIYPAALILSVAVLLFAFGYMHRQIKAEDT